eukprot:30042_1
MANGDTIGCSVYKDRLTVVPKTAINHDGTSGKGGEPTLATYCPAVPQLQAANKQIESQNRAKKKRKSRPKATTMRITNQSNHNPKEKAEPNQQGNRSHKRTQNDLYIIQKCD